MRIVFACIGFIVRVFGFFVADTAQHARMRMSHKSKKD